ncbi:MAG: hypothetical protein KDI10_19425 [Halioglobus sp.]|nr:hypothetical protein [Halioglobus sp.]
MSANNPFVRGRDPEKKPEKVHFPGLDTCTFSQASLDNRRQPGRGFFQLLSSAAFFEMQCFLHRERVGELLEGNHIAAARAPPINQFLDMKLSIGDESLIRSAKYSRF